MEIENDEEDRVEKAEAPPRQNGKVHMGLTQNDAAADELGIRIKGVRGT